MTRSIQCLLVLLAALPLALVACPEGSGGFDDDDDSAPDDDDDVTPPVDDDDDTTPGDDDDTADDDDATPPVAAVVAVHPEDGTADHYVNEGLWVDFDIEAPDAEIQLVDGDGNDIPGTAIWLSLTRLAWDSNDPLAFSSHFTATVRWAGDSQEHSWEFDTSNVGDTPTGQDLTGNTYAYDLGTGTVVAPVGGEALLGQFNAVFLQGVSGQTDTSIDFVGALAALESNPPVQDLCNESVDLNETTPATWEDPFFIAGPADVPQTLNLAGFGQVDVTFRDVTLSGLFTQSNPPDGPVDSITEATFSTIIDIRDAGLGDVCDQLGLLFPGLTCVPCPHDPAASQCVIFDLIDLEATLVDGLELVIWTTEDVDGNPDCG